MTGDVEIGQTPIDDVYVVGLHVDQDVLRLQVAVHDAVAVRVVQTPQDRVHAGSELVVVESLVVLLFVNPLSRTNPVWNRVHPFRHNIWTIRFFVPDHVQYRQNRGASLQILHNQYLSTQS